jgi:phospholipid-binding lipoprotein MlaA
MITIGHSYSNVRAHLAIRVWCFIALALPLAVSAQSDPEINDPLEPVNRGIFAFNDTVDVYAIEPVAKGYDSVVPDVIQTGVGNFFNNLRYPVYLISDLLQGKVTQMAEHTGRFLINSTVGIVGLIDVAKEVGLPDHEEDFGLALAYHGVPPGPYIVLPFIGPSNLRDTVGFVCDSFLNPFYWLGAYTNMSGNHVVQVNTAQTALRVVDIRAGLIDAIDTAKESSVDYYLFVQGAYYQHRRGVLYDGNPPDDFELEEEAQSKAAASVEQHERSNSNPTTVGSHISLGERR